MSFFGILSGLGGLLGGIGGLAGNVGGIALSKKLQKRSHEFQHNEAILAREWQTGMFERAMDYNTEQRATAYQTAVGDMKAAGLNPMLAYQQGGAPIAQAHTPGTGIPGGSSGHMPDTRFGNSIMQALSGAAAIRKVLADARVSDAQAHNVEMDTALKSQQMDTSQASAGQLRASEESIRLNMRKVESEIEKLESETTLNYGRASVADVEYTATQAREALHRAEAALRGKQGDAVTAAAELHRAQAVIQRFKATRERQESEAHGGWLGEVAPYMGVFRNLRDVGRAMRGR